MRLAIQLFGVVALSVALNGQNIEQTTPGSRPPARIVHEFDGLGVGFEGPQGTATLRNPSDNSLAVGPDHVVQTVNSRMAIFTKKRQRYEETGRVLYGPVNTNNVFRGFGGTCEARNNGDAVVRYDQLARPLADRHAHLFARRGASRSAAGVDRARDGLRESTRWRESTRPCRAALSTPGTGTGTDHPAPRHLRCTQAPPAKGPYSMCYAVSASDDPLGSYYRYEFLRPLFPDYPRPAVWPDGYYVPTSTGDEVIEKHACVVERNAMLAGKPAREQCFVINDVNFLNNADLDGTELPPRGAPNVMMAAGGTQLKKVFEDNAILAWKMFTDWRDMSKTRLEGPVRIPVAPYRYLCDGQLTNCVPQPGADRKLDAQGDKIMARLVYRRIGNQQSIVGVHSVNTRPVAAACGGTSSASMGPEIRSCFNRARTPARVRWMASPAIDKFGNIGIGYSFGGPTISPVSASPRARRTTHRAR